MPGTQTAIRRGTHSNLVRGDSCGVYRIAGVASWVDQSSVDDFRQLTVDAPYFRSDMDTLQRSNMAAQCTPDEVTPEAKACIVLNASGILLFAMSTALGGSCVKSSGF